MCHESRPDAPELARDHTRAKAGAAALSYLAAGMLIALGACDGRHSQPLQPSLAVSVVSRIEIDGPAEMAPAQSAKFRVTTVSSTGTQEDITEKSAWQTSNTNILTVTGPGVVTAHDRGETDIVVTYARAFATMRVLVLESGTYRVTGHVLEGGLPVGGVRVVVTRGIGSGLTTTANAAGVFALYGVAGDVDLTASREGYQDTTRSVTVTSHTTADVPIKAIEEPLRLAGEWTLDLRSSPSCTELPAEAEHRVYPVSIVQTGASVKITLRATFYFGSKVTIDGRVLNGKATIEFPSDAVDGAWVQETLPSGGAMGISGTAQGQEVGDAIAGQLIGAFDYYGPPGPRVNCTRTDHAFCLSRL
jgi:hypothetical protein